MSVPALFTFGAFRTISVAALLLVSGDLAEENRLASGQQRKIIQEEPFFKNPLAVSIYICKMELCIPD